MILLRLFQRLRSVQLRALQPRAVQFAFSALLLGIGFSAFSPQAQAALEAEFSFLRQSENFYTLQLQFDERVRYFSHRDLVTNGEIVSFQRLDDQLFEVELFMTDATADGLFIHLPRQQVYSIFGEWNSRSSFFLPLDQDRQALPDSATSGDAEAIQSGTGALIASLLPDLAADDANATSDANTTSEANLTSTTEAEETAETEAETNATETVAENNASSAVADLAVNEVAPEVNQASKPAAGSISAELYLLQERNSRGKKVIQIRFSSPVQGIEQRHFYANTRVDDFYGEYDDYFLELKPFADDNSSRPTRIALIADYFFNAELNRVVFVPIEIYAEFDANASVGDKAKVTYGTLSSNFVESLRQASAYVPPAVAAPGGAPVVVMAQQPVSSDGISPIVNSSKLPGDVRDLSIKPPPEWQLALVLNVGITSGGEELVDSDPATNPQVDIATTPDFPTFGVGVRWSTDQQFWQLQALLDYSSEAFETSDSTSTFNRTDIHLQWLYPFSGFTAMPFIQNLSASTGLTYSSPDIAHTGNITDSSLYTRATDLGAAVGFNYGLRWNFANGKSVVEYRGIIGMDYNAAFMSADNVNVTSPDTVSGDYTGIFYNHVF